MPMVDMPLEELKTYTGINPRPADFDAYWDRALAEMRAVDPQVERVPADFPSPVADCYDLYFTGVGGARLHAMYARPKTAPAGKAPAIVMLHGYAGSAGSWFDKVAYAAAGFHVAALDCRGQGGTSVDVGGVRGNTLHGHIIRGLAEGPEKLLYRSIFLDVAELAGIVMDMPEVDETRVGAMGPSQGGALTIACAALEPRIACLAPVYPFLSDYRRVWEMDKTAHAYKELRDYFRQYDPLHEREEEIFTALGYIDVSHLAPRIRGKVLLFAALMDETCPPSSQFATYNRIAAPKRMLLYHDYGHEALPFCDDHTYRFLVEHLHPGIGG